MLAGAVQLSDTEPEPLPTTVSPVGWPGTGLGVTAVLAALAAPKPMQLVALTLNWCALPFVRPVTVKLVPLAVAVACNQVLPPLVEYSILYALMAHPFDAGATQLTCT